MTAAILLALVLPVAADNDEPIRLRDCFKFNVDELDDGVSDALTIAKALLHECRSEVQKAITDEVLRNMHSPKNQKRKLDRSVIESMALTANARAGVATENLALKLSGDGKTLSLLYAADVAYGATEPIPLVVHSKTTSYVVAAGQQTLGETAVILDVKSWKAVVSFTGQGMLEIRGSSFLVQCS
jgi:hypothetical protein